MYYVTIKALGETEKIIYYPGDEKCCIYDAQLKLKIGECGQFEFKVPSVNICYSDLKEWSIVTIYRDDSEYFRGYISEISDDYLGNISVYCVEDLSWLNYEVYKPSAGTSTRAELLQLIIDEYNAQPGITGTDKAFECGSVYYGAGSSISYEFTYDDTMLSIVRQIAGGNLYVRVRRSNGKRYIDLLRLQDFATENAQSVQFGYNLLDYTKEMNTSYMLNVIHPYGAELETEVYEGYSERLEGTVLINEDSIKKYGRISKNVIFADVTDLTELNSQAQSYLNMNAQPRLTLELNALDMSELGASTSKLDLGDNIWVIAEPYDIEQQIRVVELNINLQDLSKNTYTLSDSIQSGKTLTSQTIATAQQADSVPKESDILKAAKKNAVNLLNGADGGYLNFIFNSDGQLTGFQITDSKNPDDATKKWLWNENGLGYMYKDSNGDWQSDIAMTMDGQILAKRGVIGSDTSAWDIGSHSIYNGTTSISDNTNNGMYVGTDGIINVATGTASEKVFTRIQGGKIYSTSQIYGASIKAGVLNADSISAGNGESATISFTGYVSGESGSKTIALSFSNGILTYFGYN